jgi:hypothetical protein
VKFILLTVIQLPRAERNKAAPQGIAGAEKAPVDDYNLRIRKARRLMTSIWEVSSNLPSEVVLNLAVAIPVLFSLFQGSRELALRVCS